MQKIMLGIAVIDRPKTTEKCLQHILRSDIRDRLSIIVVDNNSNEETKEVLQKYEKDIDLIITNDFNVGCTFAVNQWLALREPGQYCMKVDADAYILTPDWLDIMLHVFAQKNPLLETGLEKHRLGFVMGRRPAFWTDSPQRRAFYVGQRVVCFHIGLYAVEVIGSDGVIWPWVMFNPELLDTIGYMNEAANTDDVDFSCRAAAVSYLGCYIPDVVIFQNAHEPGHPEFENQYHSQYDAYKKCWESGRKKYWEDNYYIKYKLYQTIYCGTRFLLGSITDPEYQEMSNKNWEFMKNYKKEDFT